MSADQCWRLTTSPSPATSIASGIIRSASASTTSTASPSKKPSTMIATRLYQNTARIHFDLFGAKQGRFGRRLIYGGHVISLARALSFNGFANAFHVAAINGGRHVAPLFAGGTVFAWSEVLAKAELPGRRGRRRLAAAHGRDLRPALRGFSLQVRRRIRSGGAARSRLLGPDPAVTGGHSSRLVRARQPALTIRFDLFQRSRELLVFRLEPDGFGEILGGTITMSVGAFGKTARIVRGGALVIKPDRVGEIRYRAFEILFLDPARRPRNPCSGRIECCRACNSRARDWGRGELPGRGRRWRARHRSWRGTLRRGLRNHRRNPNRDGVRP